MQSTYNNERVSPFPKKHFCDFRNINIFASKISEIFFPNICYLCKEKKSELCNICPDCEKTLPLIKNPSCPGCGGENDGIFDICNKCLKEDKRPWQNAVAVASYKPPISQIIKDLKYNKSTHHAKFLGKLAAKIWKEKNIHTDCVVPIPMHWTRKIIRGYNQAELIASVFAADTGIPLENFLKRIKKTPKQANLSREERKKNLNNTFKISKLKRDFNKTRSILLLDDVLTTGATLEAAAKTLLESDICKQVNIIVIARG